MQKVFTSNVTVAWILKSVTIMHRLKFFIRSITVGYVQVEINVHAGICYFLPTENNIYE